jgi:hypothetical protein
VRELYADVGGEVARAYFRKQLMIQSGALTGFVGGGYIFSKIVDRDGEPGRVEGLGDSQNMFRFGASDETLGNPLSNGGALGHVPKPATFGQTNEESS